MDRQLQSALDELFQLAIFTAQNVIRIRKLSYDMSLKLDALSDLLTSGAVDPAKIEEIINLSKVSQAKLRAALSAVPPPPH
jgi:hypothetical protein